VSPVVLILRRARHVSDAARWPIRRPAANLAIRLTMTEAGSIVRTRPAASPNHVSSCPRRSALAFNAVRYVSRHCDRAKCFARLASDDREGHLDVQFASALVQSAGGRGTALELHYGIGDRGFEAAPMRSPQVFGNN
jgi:hypothetical protein